MDPPGWIALSFMQGAAGVGIGGMHHDRTHDLQDYSTIHG
jgi:hypothetical protein